MQGTKLYVRTQINTLRVVFHTSQRLPLLYSNKTIGPLLGKNQEQYYGQQELDNSFSVSRPMFPPIEYSLLPCSHLLVAIHPTDLPCSHFWLHQDQEGVVDHRCRLVLMRIHNSLASVGVLCFFLGGGKECISVQYRSWLLAELSRTEKGFSYEHIFIWRGRQLCLMIMLAALLWIVKDHSCMEEAKTRSKL